MKGFTDKATEAVIPINKLSEMKIYAPLFIPKKTVFADMPVNYYLINIPEDLKPKVASNLPKKMLDHGIAVTMEFNRLYLLMYRNCNLDLGDVHKLLLQKCLEITSNACTIQPSIGYEVLKPNFESHVNVMKRLFYRLFEIEFLGKYRKARIDLRSGLFLALDIYGPKKLSRLITGSDDYINKVVEAFNHALDIACKRGEKSKECAEAREKVLRFQGIRVLYGVTFLLMIAPTGSARLWADLKTFIWSKYDKKGLTRDYLYQADETLGKAYDKLARPSTEELRNELEKALKNLGIENKVTIGYKYIDKNGSIRNGEFEFLRIS